MSFTRAALVGGVLVAAAFASSADATCVTTSVCEESRPVATCVGTKCVVVNVPLCLHGQVGSGYYQTVWC